MNIEYKLKDYLYKNLELQQIQDRVIGLRSMAYSIKSASDMTGIASTNKSKNKVVEVMCELEQLEFEYIEKMEFIIKEQKEIEDIIKNLEPVERLIIRSKYIEGNNFDVICVLIGYSYRQTLRIHEQILKKLKDGTQCHIKE